jgi:hypothetical protein
MEKGHKAEGQLNGKLTCVLSAIEERQGKGMIFPVFLLKISLCFSFEIQLACLVILSMILLRQAATLK